MSEKIYCGNAKIRKTNFGDQMQISLSKDDINKIVGYVKSEKLDWVNINVKEKREAVEGKPTHYLEIDTWKPDPNFKKEERKAVILKDTTNDDLPFA